MSESARPLSEWVKEPTRWGQLLSGTWRWMRLHPRRSFGAGGLFLLVLVVGSLSGSRSSDGLLLSAVLEGPFDVRIVESGTLQALRSVTYSSSIPGSQAKILEILPEGAHANVGDVLVQFDAQPFTEELDQTRAQLAQAEAELIKAREEEKLLVIASNEELTESRDKVRLAELELESVVEGKGKLAEAESAAQLSQAKRELVKAESSYEDLKPLLAEGFITKLELDRAKQAVDKALEDLELLEIKHRTYLQYTRPAEMEGSRSALTNSKESMRQASRANTFRLSQASATLKLAESKYAELLSKVELQSENLNRCEIRASVSGLVIYKEVFFGSEKRKVQVGDQVWPNQPLIMMPDLSRMIVETHVRETDIYKVEKNQRVSISVDAYPEIELSGEVSFIGTLAQADEARRGGKYFSVTILVEDVDPRLRPGMSARVELLVDHLENARYVPLEAVFERGGKHYVYVAARATPEPREVLVGPSNDNHIVIEQGLELDERVLLRDPDDRDTRLGSEPLPGILDVVPATP